MLLRSKMEFFVLLGLFCVIIPHATAIADPQKLQIRESVKLDPKVTYGALEILASDITIDGNGAVLLGDISIAPKDRSGAGVFANNVQGVNLKNLNVKGFGAGLELIGCSDWNVWKTANSPTTHRIQISAGGNRS
ncbi:MAG: hypothetical protein MUC83_07000 [Pirellula sp.]|nr:hypothetical protein [Pirellula sp.]